MAAIPGPILLIVGLLVGGFAFFFNDKSFGFNGPFALFLYIAILFSFYGFIKTMIWYIMRKSDQEIKEEAKQTASNSQTQQNQSAFEHLQRIDFDRDREAMSSRCGNCGLLHYSHANFCQNCGNRLK